jgi:DNA-binding transcriptional MerR regulator
MDPHVDRVNNGTEIAEPALTISTVAEQTGLSAATLRAWQTRYGLSPSRTTSGGHRRYTFEDVVRLRLVRDLVSQGIAPGEAARSVLAAARGREEVPHLDLPVGLDKTAHRLAALALDLDGPATRALLREQLARRGVLDTWEDLLRPVLAAIGAQWPEVPHGIAVEHLLSHVASVVLGESVRRTPSPDDPGVLLACVPGELHDLPLVALWAALDPTRCAASLLGARTPADTLVAAAERHRPAVVVLFTLLPDWAHPGLLDELPEDVSPVAAGPGWDVARLPDHVVHVDDLLDAAEAVTQHL